MSQQGKRVGDSQLSKWIEHIPSHDEEFELLRLTAAQARLGDDASAAVVRQLNGPLTALLIYIGEIKEHSHQFSEANGNRAYLQQVVENALQQTEHVCALVRQIANSGDGPVVMSRPAAAGSGIAGPVTAKTAFARRPRCSRPIPLGSR